jgi:TolB protein
MNRPFRFPAVLLVIGLLLSACSNALEPTVNSPSIPSSVTPSPSSQPTSTSTPTQTTTPQPGDLTQTFLLSMEDNGYNHLFAYSPTRGEPVRLTNGLWDDVSPVFNSDGSRVVFASNRNAYWDIYILNLVDGQVSRVTDTPDFDGNPSWSPDDQWIIYETMVGDQIEIGILSTSNPGQTIRLTDHPALDQSPVWSPQGREVAFVSNRSGENEIWLVKLDTPDESRFINLSQSPLSDDTRPAWSPDGSKLAWAGHRSGEPEMILTWDGTQPDSAPRQVGLGDWPIWSATGTEIATRLTRANHQYLVAYSQDGTLALPPAPLGDLRGLDWHLERFTNFRNVFYKQTELTLTPAWQLQTEILTDVPGQRAGIVKLQDVDAPQPFLHDATNESFIALRQRVILDTGWDALASLEDAYTPLSTTLDPGRGRDWLFTGRAFTINPLTMNAGWMVVMREDLDGSTYWRVFLRAVAQDGSQGEPLRQLPWDLSARYSLDPAAYDQGGAYATSIPTGFWVDLTALAHKYSWERPAAMDNWRSYFKGTQFNEFIMTGGQDWHSAMLELYPADIFITPTVVIPPTRTATATPKGYRYKTPTPTPTMTPTMRPTFTPSP